MILQAHSKDNKLFIAMYETEEPKPTPCKPKHHGYCEDFCQGKCQENDAEIYAEWQSSKREYEVRESDKEKVKQEIYKNWKGYGADSHPDLEDSIDCTFLKDRLKKNLIFKADRTTNDPDIYEWTLLPLEDKKENEAETIETLKERILELESIIFGKDKQIESLKSRNMIYIDRIQQSLPGECIMGCTEVKFCSHRNGEGNECKNCINK